MKPYNDRDEGGKWQGAYCCRKHNRAHGSGRKRARRSGRKEIEEIEQDIDDEKLEKLINNDAG